MVKFGELELRIDESPAADVVEKIEESLLTALGQRSAASGYGSLGVIARKPGGEVVGGLIGSISYGWLLVKMLWVSEKFRGRGLGRVLMQMAEQEGLRRCCHAAWLDTSSTRARDFYLRLGYQVFGKLENAPGEQPERHGRWFMSKRLIA